MTLVSAPPLGTAGNTVDGRSMRAQVDQDLAFMDRPSNWRDALGTGVVQQLRHRASVHGERIALRYLDRGEREIDTATYAELDIAALRVATALRSAGAVGRPVLIALPQGLDFVRCFLGCLYAGAIAIPAPALGDPRGLERIEAIIRHARPALIVGTADGVSRLGRDAKMSSEAFATAVDLLQGSPDSIFDDITPNNIAFLQYTSGSTSSPKGVVITHGNIAADLAMIETAFGQTDASSTVSWLPLHHDMGLIGCVLEPLHLGASAILMSPLAFLQRPARWLRALDVYGATTAGAPNFGYDMCVRAVTDAQIPHLDLSRWNLAFCGSEPVRATSLARFADRFARYGFAASAFYPCYGQAEATLFVTGGRPGAGPVIADHSVGCGFPWLGCSVALLERDEPTPSADLQDGEIAIAGPQVSPGFWDPDHGIVANQTREVILDGRRHMRTGDLGRWVNGNLHVVGRIRSMIIVRGANIHAEDVERTALSHPEAGALGAIVALPVLDGDHEGLALVCELGRGTQADAASDLPAALAAAIGDTHGVLPDEVILVPPGTISRTLSGKLQHEETRRRLQAGEISVVHRHRTPRVRAPVTA